MQFLTIERRNKRDREDAIKNFKDMMKHFPTVNQDVPFYALKANVAKELTRFVSQFPL